MNITRKFHIIFKLRQNLIDSKGKFSCEKQKYPPDLPPEQECEKYLKQAEKLVPEDKKEEFKTGSMIEISDGEESFECYKREKWETQYGWCETVKSKMKSKHWGFCSPSCQYVHSGSETVKLNRQSHGVLIYTTFIPNILAINFNFKLKQYYENLTIF